jgi:ATP-binding cassette, subfamily B (MDR/TAP), member 11
LIARPIALNLFNNILFSEALCGICQVKILSKFIDKDKKNLEEAKRLINESISNIHSVASLNKETYFIEKFNLNLDYTYKNSIRSANINGFIYGLTISIFFYSIAAAYSLGSYLVSHNLFNMSLENMMLAFNCVIYGAQSFFQESALLPDYAKAKQAIKSIFNLFDIKPVINNWDLNPNGIKLTDENYINAEIDLKQVEFSFPSRKEAKILNGLDLNIKNGQKVGLVGKSGCGKSTITQLIERFYDPDCGQILLNNKDLKDFNIEWLRSKIGIVSQEPILFNV